MGQKQSIFKECLSDMKHILDQNHQEFFLVYGTLLGQQRENAFISHDNDIDLGIFKDKFNVDIISKIVNSGKFKIDHVYGKLEDSYEISFRHTNGTPIDIFLHYKIEPGFYYAASFTDICDNKKEKFCKWGHHIDGLTEIMFCDELYKIPSNSHEYLSEKYGDWKIPKKYTYNEGLKFRSPLN